MLVATYTFNHPDGVKHHSLTVKTRRKETVYETVAKEILMLAKMWDVPASYIKYSATWEERPGR